MKGLGKAMLVKRFICSQVPGKLPVMRWQRLTLALVVMIPAGAFLGAISTLNSGFPVWWGLAVGRLIGVFFG